MKVFCFSLALVLGACADKDASDDSAAADDSATDDTSAEGETTAVVATVSDDYAVGTLATVSLEGWAVQDEIVDLTGDTAVIADGGYVFRLDRFAYDSVSVYTPGDWSAPIAQFALADLANPHTVVMCDGAAFITQYGADHIAVHDPETGALRGTVDLSSFDDGDGTPEASTMVMADNGKLYVGMQRLDRAASWAEAGGRVAEVDCASRAVTRSWEVEGQANVYAYSPDGAQLVVDSGEGLHLLDTTTGTLSAPLLDEVAEGISVVGFTSHGDRAVVAFSDASYSYGIGCVDLGTWSFTEAERVDNYLISLSGDARGEAWISARTHWSNPAAENGLIVYDVATCTSLTTSGPIATLLAPFSVAFY
ncbi:MAG: hypothetical protein H6739_28105 [Alphaproteobacteria bacterium]|nr:hypothetical protein [Alphaproteobacteria bacterium]